MSTQADHGHELIPLPEQTPDALRAALAVVDPGRPTRKRRTAREACPRPWRGSSSVAVTGP
ncbi:hypothetical protein ACFYOV_20265 [Streptomyces sp. NPDC005931]|uniref:hypothetical protein n=1 Tax=Streptomyces sp. NPDC005931 TaxID=3364737 RepID=UPI0036CA4536